MFSWSVNENPDIVFSYKTVSALKFDNKSEFNASESWKTDFISSTVYATISLIETSATTVLSFITNCSPFIKVPVVSDNAISSAPVESASIAAYPIAPLALPLILDPLITFADVNALHFKIVNVWISYKYKSNWVFESLYDASVTLYEYTLASPIRLLTTSSLIVGLLLPLILRDLLNLIIFAVPPPMFIKGVPCTLLTRSKLPISNGIDARFTVSVSLGLSTSSTVVPGKSTSNPLTYARPGDNFTQNISSLGIFPSSVNLFSVNKPSFPISLLRDSWISTRNGSTE